MHLYTTCVRMDGQRYTRKHVRMHAWWRAKGYKIHARTCARERERACNIITIVM